MPKSKTIHIRMTDELFKRMAIAAIGEEVTRNEFIERAISEYCECLEDNED